MDGKSSSGVSESTRTFDLIIYGGESIRDFGSMM